MADYNLAELDAVLYYVVQVT